MVSLQHFSSEPEKENLVWQNSYLEKLTVEEKTITLF